MSRAVNELARSLEATLVRPVALAAEVEQFADRAQELSCAALVVLPPLVGMARARLGRGPVRVVAAIGLPFGAEGAQATAAACAQAVAEGADTLDVVASLPLLANGDFPACAQRAGGRRGRRGRRGPRRTAHRRASRDRGVLPQPAAWRLAARMAASAGCDGVVCATGLGPEGATPAAIDALRARAARRAASSRRRAASARWPTRGARWTPAPTCSASPIRPACSTSSRKLLRRDAAGRPRAGLSGTL